MRSDGTFTFCRQANYGKKDKACVAAIKAIYVDLELEAKFKAYEAATYKNLCAAIDAQQVRVGGV